MAWELLQRGGVCAWPVYRACLCIIDLLLRHAVSAEPTRRGFPSKIDAQSKNVIEA